MAKRCVYRSTRARLVKQVSWGAHELVLAARNLLRAAMSDPLNQKFALLSESGISLYPPSTIYMQLLAEDKSRIDSCGIGVCRPQATHLYLSRASSQKLHFMLHHPWNWLGNRKCMQDVHMQRKKQRSINFLSVFSLRMCTIFVVATARAIFAARLACADS